MDSATRFQKYFSVIFYLPSWQYFELTLDHFYAIGQILLVTNDQLLYKLSRYPFGHTASGLVYSAWTFAIDTNAYDLNSTEITVLLRCVPIQAFLSSTNHDRSTLAVRWFYLPGTRRRRKASLFERIAPSNLSIGKFSLLGTHLPTYVGRATLIEQQQ